MRLSHILHPRPHPLAHKPIRHLPTLALRPPRTLLLIRGLRRKRIALTDMPQRSPGHFPTCLVDDFDPVAGGIGPVPRDLTFDGFFECGRAGFLIGAEDREEELPQSGMRSGVSGPFHFDDLAEFGVCGYFVELESHCFGTIGGLVVVRMLMILNRKLSCTTVGLLLTDASYSNAASTHNIAIPAPQPYSNDFDKT